MIKFTDELEFEDVMEISHEEFDHRPPMIAIEIDGVSVFLEKNSVESLIEHLQSWVDSVKIDT